MNVTKSGNGKYLVSGKAIAQLSDIPEAIKALKKPIPVTALKIDTSFTVETPEGIMTGKPGDYLMEGVNGELYICPADVFAKSYDVL